jgi:hypothetical protein
MKISGRARTNSLKSPFRGSRKFLMLSFVVVILGGILGRKIEKRYRFITRALLKLEHNRGVELNQLALRSEQRGIALQPKKVVLSSRIESDFVQYKSNVLVFKKIFTHYIFERYFLGLDARIANCVYGDVFSRICGVFKHTPSEVDNALKSSSSIKLLAFLDILNLSGLWGESFESIELREDYNSIPLNELVEIKERLINKDQMLEADRSSRLDFQKEKLKFVENIYADLIDNRTDKVLKKFLCDNDLNCPYRKKIENFYRKIQVYQKQNIDSPEHLYINFEKKLKDGRSQFSVANRKKLFIEILGLSQKSDEIEVEHSFELAPKITNFPIYETFYVNTLFPASQDIFIFFRIKGRSEVYSLPVDLYPAPKPNSLRIPILNASLDAYKKFFKTSPNGKIYPSQKKIQINELVVLPKGKTFVLESGAVIDLIEGGGDYFAISSKFQWNTIVSSSNNLF